ncbi:hypothetical protein [Zavarzinella formosa]|nr:hypothetical protein [Zavarzinella formosa]
MSLTEARALVDGEELRLLKYRDWHECKRLGEEFETLGAEVRVGF